MFKIGMYRDKIGKAEIGVSEEHSAIPCDRDLVLGDIVFPEIKISPGFIIYDTVS